ncbi:hypothetical protein GJ744_004383 [Endocarpon pusillum]|uniref:Uncharacterized protein n=1 Tax=Endocarpon pusillum TaxID=364733 RepID=A0A8H7ARJ8_9EURO|nr:hypothetical protein GJ744_004383 [Endocarpon pusillum]
MFKPFKLLFNRIEASRSNEKTQPWLKALEPLNEPPPHFSEHSSKASSTMNTSSNASTVEERAEVTSSGDGGVLHSRWSS